MRPIRFARTVARASRHPAPPPGRVALVGRPWAVDAVAAALVAAGGDRRALAPLPRPEPSLLRQAAAVIGCAVTIDEARRATRAHLPLVVALPVGADRHAYAALPRLGHGGLVAPLPDGRIDVEALFATLARRLDGPSATALAPRLPALVPLVEAAALARLPLRAALGTVLGGSFAGAAAVLGDGPTLHPASAEDDAAGPPHLTLIAAGATLAAGSFARGRVARAAVTYAVARATLSRG